MRGRDEPSYEDDMSVRNEVKRAWRQCNGRVRAGAAYVNLALASLEGDDGRNRHFVSRSGKESRWVRVKGVVVGNES